MHATYCAEISHTGGPGGSKIACKCADAVILVILTGTLT
jgi:hypothetical protein